MNDKEQDTLNRNHYFLKKNIILTDEFYDLLKSCNVLPESMIKEIKSGKTREDKNSILIKLLPLGWSDSYRKFRHVLNVTGHTILADQLHEDGSDAIKMLNAEEIFSKFPSVFNQISDDVKTKFLRFLETKMREKVLKKEWEHFPLERSGKLDAKKAIFEIEKEFKSNLDEKKRQMNTVSIELAEMREICRRRDVEVEILHREMAEMKDKYKASVNVQGKFNAANNNTIIRLHERFSLFNSKVKSLNLMLRRFMSEHEEVYESESDTKVSTLEKNLKMVLQAAQSNKEIAGKIASEREIILSLLNKSVNKKQPLPDIIKTFLEKEEKRKVALLHEIEKLTEVIAEKRSYGNSKCSKEITDMRVLRNMIAAVRVEVEHLKKKVQWKDNQITDLLQENGYLRQNVGNGKIYDKSFGTTTTFSTSSIPSSPESTADIKFNFQTNFEEHMQINQLPRIPKYQIPDSVKSDINGQLSRESTNTSVDMLDEMDENEKSNPRNTKTPEQRTLNLTGLPVVHETDSLVSIQSNAPRDKLFHFLNHNVPSEKSRTQTPLDLLTVVETSEDNTELERVSEIMVEKTKSCKLPSLINGATLVDMNHLKSTSHKKFEF